MTSTRVAKTQKEAAVELVRLEFDAERLRMGIDQALGRAQSYQAELDQNQSQRAKLISLLAP